MESQDSNPSQWVRELAKMGYTYHQIQAVTGLSLYKVFQLGRSHGTRRKNKISDRQRRKLLTLVGTKQSLRAIAQKVGCSKDTVRQTRMSEAAHVEGSAKARRCPTCGGLINTYKCVLCSFAKPK